MSFQGWSCCRKRTTDFSEFLSIKVSRRPFQLPSSGGHLVRPEPGDFLSDRFGALPRHLPLPQLVLCLMQGCTRGRHSNEKPHEPVRPEAASDKGEIIYQGPKCAEALQRERPR